MKTGGRPQKTAVGLLLGGQYRLRHEVARCGEAEIYLADDQKTGARVTVYEFFPPKILSRDPKTGKIAAKPGCEVMMKSLSSDFEELYLYLKEIGQSEKREGRVVPVTEVFRENGTIYAVAEPFEAESFDDYLARLGQPMSWLRLKKAIAPLVATLGRMHADGVYHRGISPDTVLVDPDGKFWLSGFSIPAARTAGSEIDATLYFGYSAPEQYASNSWQGAWSDVYSLAALCYRALTGTTPVEWRQRGEGRVLIPPAELSPSVPDQVSNALVTALSVNLRTRYKTVEEFWCGLLSGPGDGTAVFAGAILPPIDRTRPRKGSRAETALWLLAVCAMVIICSAAAIRIVYRDVLLPLSSSASEPAPGGENNLPPEGAGESSSEPEPEPPEIVVPNLVGTHIDTVRDNPLYENLFTFEVQWDYSETRPVGEVMAQDPKSGEKPGSGGVITVLVSKGTEMISMPTVVGVDLERAGQILGSLGISYEVETLVDDTTMPNTVVESSVEPGTVLYRTRDKVTLTVTKLME